MLEVRCLVAAVQTLDRVGCPQHSVSLQESVQNHKNGQTGVRAWVNEMSSTWPWNPVLISMVKKWMKVYIAQDSLDV